MSDATEAETVEGVDAEQHDPFVEFQGLYRDWLSARAACADFTSDKEMTLRTRRLDAAELALLAMPAPPGRFALARFILNDETGTRT
jgi:hypothetical protein